jgi:3-dehydroquinate synthase
MTESRKDPKDDQMHITIKRVTDDSYDIVFKERLFPRIASDLKQHPIGKRYAIITDSNVRKLYARQLESSLRDEGLDAATFSFDAGEENKTIENCMKIIGEMSKLRYGRDSAILALGGGVVGDMAGFISAIFNRGIPYIQIPTTIIAQADSSIGGKTAVNTEYGKNLVGVFKQPKRVYIDVATLATLSERDYSSGLAETIKHGIICDAGFFDYLSNNIDTDSTKNLIKNKNPQFLINIAKNNCRIKGRIVEKDPDEKGLRRILNYGHTIGHAIEKLSVDLYKKKKNNNKNSSKSSDQSYLSHGAAIAIGMMAAGRISCNLGYFTEKELSRQKKLLLAAGLPTTIPKEISDEDILEITTRDKKSKDGKARYVLPTAIGKMHEFNGEYAIFVDDKIVLDALRETR